MIPGIVLAGGRSSRMGRPKALLPVGKTGELFVERIVRTLAAAGVPRIAVVVGADAVAIRAGFHPPPLVQLVDNPDHARGQLTSLLAGMNAVDTAEVQAVLVTLVDLPFVEPETVGALLAAYDRTRAPVVRPVSRGRHGHPVIFDRALFSELRTASPEGGAKPVIKAHAHEIVEVPVDGEGAFTDIDTPDEYERLAT